MTIKGFRKMKKDPVTLVDGFRPNEDFSGILSEGQWNSEDENATKAKLKELEKVKKDTTVTKMLKNCLDGYQVQGNVDSGKLDYLKALFDAPKDVKASEISGDITTYLTNHQAALKSIDDVKKNLEDKISKMEEAAKKQQEGHDKIEGNDKSASNARQVEQKKAEVARAICTVTNTCVGKLSSAALDAVKFNIKQCRAAYIKIASKGAPNVHESAELLEAMLDADEYEVDSFFEQASYDYDELTA